MGLMRKVVRKSVRKVTPRPVRKVQRAVTHPVRTSVRTITPKPIRNLERAAYNVAHPINAGENKLLNELIGPPIRYGPKRSPERSSLAPRQQASRVATYTVSCFSCRRPLTSPVGTNLQCPYCGVLMDVMPPSQAAEQTEREGGESSASAPASATGRTGCTDPAPEANRSASPSLIAQAPLGERFHGELPVAADVVAQLLAIARAHSPRISCAILSGRRAARLDTGRERWAPSVVHDANRLRRPLAFQSSGEPCRLLWPRLAADHPQAVACSASTRQAPLSRPPSYLGQLRD
jgi:hypothetical protein